ncbi:adenylate/guanylate cyclase domain-containing protein [Patulibacter defluvii]|uniref:adenylate/guanylate cyclase domain-containing protein n=1 Tax=Patulibacter defluvii TaxID=3095358 RepID=UPI002A764EFE|nr:adenylate/guanylate cyclase domain-containing protein [Patulibacter sp. DM4]
MNSVAERHSFLFADLVGFTTLTAEDGDDRAAEVAVGFFATVRELLPAHAADEVKTLGDGVMLRCDDPLLAARLGLAIVAEHERRDAPPVRVGIHTGPAVRRGDDWYGMTVNVAARLCSAAGGGEVLVSAATVEAVGDPGGGLAFGERRLHWLKNVNDPVPAHPVLAVERRVVPWCDGRERRAVAAWRGGRERGRARIQGATT